MKITLEQIKTLYAQSEIDMSEKDYQETLDQCNEQDGMSGRSAMDWAVFFGRQIEDEQRGDELEYRRFRRDAYGND